MISYAEHATASSAEHAIASYGTNPMIRVTPAPPWHCRACILWLLTSMAAGGMGFEFARAVALEISALFGASSQAELRARTQLGAFWEGPFEFLSTVGWSGRVRWYLAGRPDAVAFATRMELAAVIPVCVACSWARQAGDVRPSVGHTSKYLRSIQILWMRMPFWIEVWLPVSTRPGLVHVQIYIVYPWV